MWYWHVIFSVKRTWLYLASSQELSLKNRIHEAFKPCLWQPVDSHALDSQGGHCIISHMVLATGLALALMFMPCQKALTLIWIDKMVSCIVMDSSSESKDILFLLPLQWVWNIYVSKANEKTENNWINKSAILFDLFQPTFCNTGAH